MKNIKYTAFIAGITILIVFIFALEIHYMGLESVSFLTKLILFVLLNLNLVALLTLMFFVGKSLLKIYLERKSRVLGSKFKTKFVVVLVSLTLVPSAFLFIVSSGIVTNYLDRWFDPQIKQPVFKSIGIAQSVYEMHRQQTLLYAKAIAEGKSLPENYSVIRLSTLPDNPSEILRSGFEGVPGTEIVSAEDGDIVRAVVPLMRGTEIRGVLVVEKPVSRSLSEYAEAIQEAYQNYLTLESWKIPIKMNYILLLSFFTAMIVFMALWVGLKMSRGIVDPLQKLVQSTEQIAGGNLDVHIPVESDDEMGQLVRSFNNMVKGLKEGYRSSRIIENIIENINSGVISFDTDGNILTINSAAGRILSIAPGDYIGRNYSDLIALLKSDELNATIKKINIRDFKRMEKEIRVTVQDRQVLLRIYIASLRDPRSYLGTLVVFDDLTEVVQAQKALVWQEVARRIAHEIKNPLTPIKLSTERIMKKWHNQSDDFGHAFERATETIIREVDSLKRLVDEFSRLGKMPEIKKVTVHVSTIIEGVIALYKDYHGIDIRFSREDDEPYVDVDPEQFKRVLINIVDNAIQAMQNEGNIEIALHRRDGSLTIDIADNGPGIRDEDREKLFLPYFSTKRGGTGLGLAIARKVITEHDGSIKIRNNIPTGTVFMIELPIKGA